MTGIVVEVDVREPARRPAAVKPIRQVLDAEPFVPADVIDLAKWTAEYYAAGAGETITAVLPPKTRGARADAPQDARGRHHGHYRRHGGSTAKRGRRSRSRPTPSMATRGARGVGRRAAGSRSAA